MTPLGHRALALAAALAALAALPAAQAQSGDLGELTITVPSRARGGAFVLVTRLDVPEPSEAELPPDAVAPHARWREARALAREVRARLASAAETERVALLPSLAAREASLAAAAAELRRALEADEGALSRAALLRLGMLHHDTAEAAYADALDAADACLGAGRADCVDPRIEDVAALRVWARVTGADVLAAWALYQRAKSLEDAGDHEAAVPLLESVLGVPDLPPTLEAASAQLLGLLSPTRDAASVARGYGRCAALGVEGVSPRCALLGATDLAALGQVEEALALLAPVLGAESDVRSDAERLAGSILARFGQALAARVPAVLPAGPRARVLELASADLASAGHVTWAIEALAAADTLAPAPERAVRIAELERIRAERGDDAERWLRRAVRFCVGEPHAVEGTFTIRWRFGAHGAGPIRVTIGTDPMRELRAISACLRERAPPPEARLSGSHAAHVRITSD